MSPPHATVEFADAPVAAGPAKSTNGQSDIPSYVLPPPTYADANDTHSDANYEYDHLLPHFPDVHWAPLEEFKASPDRGLFGDENYSRLLTDGVTIEHLLPTIGTEIKGLNLATLTDDQKDDLARLIARRGVVFLRDQKDFTVEKQMDLGRYWGRLHKHATTSLPKQPGLEEIHVVYSDGKRPPRNLEFTQQDLWHSDVTYEIQPPSYTSFKVITTPTSGGDTLWVSGAAIYDQLSPNFQKYLEGLKAVHSAHEQAIGARASGTTVRREPIVTIHPVVRTHPVTGWKSVFVNPGFTRSIVGVPKVESDAILQFLFKLISQSVDITVRYKWTAKDAVAIWDNRSCVHSATYDFWPETRHAIRVTPHGERPVFTGGKSRQEDLDEKAGRPKGFRLKLLDRAYAVGDAGYKD